MRRIVSIVLLVLGGLASLLVLSGQTYRVPPLGGGSTKIVDLLEGESFLVRDRNQTSLFSISETGQFAGSQANQPSGYAQVGSDGRIPLSIIPNSLSSTVSGPPTAADCLSNRQTITDITNGERYFCPGGAGTTPKSYVELGDAIVQVNDTADSINGAANSYTCDGACAQSFGGDDATVKMEISGSGQNVTVKGRSYLYTHATDCTSVTGARKGQACWEEDINTVFMCEAADGLCNTAGEWTRIIGNVVSDPIWDAKGDLAVGLGADNAGRLPVGTNGQILIADSATSTGLSWVPHRSPIFHRDYTTVTGSNTTSQVTLYSFTVPGGSLGTNRSLVVEVIGTQLNNSGSTVTYKPYVYFGTSNCWFSNPAIASTVDTRPLYIRAVVTALNSTTSQWVSGIFINGSASAVTTTCTSAFSQDSATDKTLEIRMDMSVANANASFTKRVAFAYFTE